jgi:hypothetical protein
MALILCNILTLKVLVLYQISYFKIKYLDKLSYIPKLKDGGV